MKQEEGSAKYYMHQWPETQQPTYQLYQASSGYLGADSFAQDSYYSMPWNYDPTMSYSYSLWQQAFQIPTYCSQQALTAVNPC
jgi:predicted acyl esterase